MTSQPKPGSTYNKLPGGAAPYPGTAPTNTMNIGEGIDMKIPDESSREMRGFNRTMNSSSPPPIVPSAGPAGSSGQSGVAEGVDLDHRDWSFILSPSDCQNISALMKKTQEAFASRWHDMHPEIMMSSLGDVVNSNEWNIFERERSLSPSCDVQPSAQASIITNKAGALTLVTPPLSKLSPRIVATFLGDQNWTKRST